jgi:hypothetical protein
MGAVEDIGSMPSRRFPWLPAAGAVALYVSTYIALVAIGDRRICSIGPGGFDTLMTWPACCFAEDLHADDDGIHPTLTMAGWLFLPLIAAQSGFSPGSFSHRLSAQEQADLMRHGTAGRVQWVDINGSRYMVDSGG